MKGNDVISSLKIFFSTLQRPYPIWIRRILTAWITAAWMILLWSNGKPLTAAMGADISLWQFVLPSGLMFIFLTLLPILFPSASDQADAWIFVGILCCYLLTVLARTQEIYLYLGLMIVLALAYWHVMPEDSLGLARLTISCKTSLFLAICLFVMMAGFIGMVTCLRYLTYSAPNYDFGIFCNMFHNMATHFLPLVSSERDQILSHFAVHVSPIYYLLLPAYWLFPNPLTLQIGQAVVVASGILPLWLICREKKLSGKLTVAICAVYAFFPALSGGCFYDIHENCFLAPLLLWVFYGYERKKDFILFPASILVLLVKEDAAIYIAFFAIYLLVGKRDWKRGIALFMMAAVYFLGVTWYLNTYGDGVMNYRYENYLPNENSSLFSMILTIFRNPALVFYESFNADKLKFMIQMFVPLCFLPFASRKPSRWLLILPLVLINVMTNYVYQYSIWFQYVFGSSVFLIYGSLLNLADMKESSRRTLAALATTATILLFFTTVYDRVYYLDKYKIDREALSQVTEILNEIDPDASVSCSTFYLPHMYQRREIYEEGRTKHRTKYVVLDLRGYNEEETITKILKYQEDGYEIQEYIDSLIVVMNLP